MNYYVETITIRNKKIKRFLFENFPSKRGYFHLYMKINIFFFQFPHSKSVSLTYSAEHH